MKHQRMLWVRLMLRIVYLLLRVKLRVRDKKSVVTQRQDIPDLPLIGRITTSHLIRASLLLHKPTKKEDMLYIAFSSLLGKSKTKEIPLGLIDLRYLLNSYWHRENAFICFLIHNVL